MKSLFQNACRKGKCLEKPILEKGEQDWKIYNFKTYHRVRVTSCYSIGMGTNI
jgi:hypothetical protein